jgi:hypothetical protein
MVRVGPRKREREREREREACVAVVTGPTIVAERDPTPDR